MRPQRHAAAAWRATLRWAASLEKFTSGQRIRPRREQPPLGASRPTAGMARVNWTVLVKLIAIYDFADNTRKSAR